MGRKFECIDELVGRNGVIQGYILQGAKDGEMFVTVENLKLAMQNNLLVVTNLEIDASGQIRHKLY
jgi:hypothetical protein